MADASFHQGSFLGGEWSQTAQGNWELPPYRIAMSTCLNGLPVEQGAWVRRPGSLYETHTRGGAAGRLVTWSFKQSLPYNIEFTASYLRFHTGTRPAFTNDTQTVSAISSANPAVVHTGAVHGWSTGDTVMFPTLGSAMPRVANRQFTITVTDTTHFSLADALTGATIDGSLLSTFVSGTAARIAEISSPYTDALWPTVRVVQAQQQAVLLQGSQPPQVLTAVPPTSSADATFTLTPAQFVDGPYLDPQKGAALTPASVTGIVGFTVISPTWSSSAAYNTGDFVLYSSVVYKSLIDTNVGLQPDTHSFAWVVVTQDKVFGSSGLLSSDIGRHIRLLSEPADWAAGTTYAAGTNVKYNYGYWTSVVGSNTGNTPGADISKWVIATNAALWTWGKITSLVGSAATLLTSGTPVSINADNSIPPYARFNAVADAFDGVVSKNVAASAQTDFWGNGSSYNHFGIGKDFGGSPQSCSYVILTAPTDRELVTWNGPAGVINITLRGKTTLPANSADGVTLGTATNVANTPGISLQLFSTDNSTQYRYLWVEVVPTFVGGGNPSVVCVAQAQFFTAGSFSGTGISVQILGPSLLYTSAINSWRLGLFTSAAGYPACGTYHEGRLWLSGFMDNRVDASALCDIYGDAVSTFFNFSPTLLDMTVTSACAIDYTLDGPDDNTIFWMEPDQQGLIFGTQAGEWLAQATTANQVLSPLTMQAHRVTKIGCANILPRRTDHTLVFAQAYQTKLMEYFADIFSGKFSAPNLAEKAQHLANRKIAELAYQKVLSPLLWARCNDGSLIGASYKRDTLMSSQGPTFIGWHQHTLGSGRVVESIATGPSSGGSLETLGMITNDPNTNVRHIEYLTNIWQETQDITTAWQLDDAITPSTYAVSGTNLVLTGLWHLNGETVSVWAGGVDAGDWVVANGSLSVPLAGQAGQTNDLFTSAFISAFSGEMPVVVGFTFPSQGQLVRPALPQDTGARNGPGIGKNRRVHGFSALMVTAQGVSFGTDLTAVDPYTFTYADETALPENVLYSGMIWDMVDDDNSRDGQLCWSVTRPYPCIIASIGGFIQTRDQ